MEAIWHELTRKQEVLIQQYKEATTDNEKLKLENECGCINWSPYSHMYNCENSKKFFEFCLANAIYEHRQCCKGHSIPIKVCCVCRTELHGPYNQFFGHHAWHTKTQINKKKT